MPTTPKRFLWMLEVLHHFKVTGLWATGLGFRVLIPASWALEFGTRLPVNAFDAVFGLLLAELSLALFKP